MLLLDKQGLLEPYAPKDLAAIKPEFRDPAQPPAWVGMNAWVAAVCFNTVEAAKSGLPKPVIVVRPRRSALQGQGGDAASGLVGHRLSSTSPAWIKTFGEAKAWEFMDRLHDNIVVYEHSGLRALSPRGRRGLSGRHLVTSFAAAQARQQGRADRGAGDEGRRRLGHGCRRHPARHEASPKRPVG